MNRLPVLHWLRALDVRSPLIADSTWRYDNHYYKIVRLRCILDVKLIPSPATLIKSNTLDIETRRGQL